MKQDQKKNLDSERRKFIKGSLVTGVGVATATVLPGVVIATEEDSPGQPKEQKAIA